MRGKKKPNKRARMWTGNPRWERGVPICFWLCVKCASLDTSSIPPEINPWAPVPVAPTLPSLSTHHVCSVVCVCVRVYVERGSAGPVPQHLQGATEKTVVCLREREKHKEERVEGQQACQSRPSLLEWVPPSLLLSVSSSHSCFISSAVTLSCFFILSLSTCALVHRSSFIDVFIAMFCVFCKILSFIFFCCITPVNAPRLYPFRSDSNGQLLSLVVKPFLLFFSLCLNYVNTCVLVLILLVIHLFCLLCTVLVLYQ